jgi:hypothetical protein
MNQFDPVCISPQHSPSYYTLFLIWGFQMDAFLWSTSSKSSIFLDSLMRASRYDDSNLFSTAPETLLRHDQERR